MRRGLLLLGAALALSGCGHLDLSGEGDPARVAVGEVDLGGPQPLPAGTTVTVRVLDASHPGAPPDVLGSQTITAPATAPVAFRVEYRADDDLLRHGVNLEARVSFDGRVRYVSATSYSFSLGNAAEAHRIRVVPAGP
jgi:uncharacterized lipoprotein YbaY